MHGRLGVLQKLIVHLLKLKIKESWAENQLWDQIGNQLWDQVGNQVWDQVMEPNSELKPHRHENDYVLVDLQGAKLHVEMLPGNESEFEGEFEFEGKRGDVHIVKKGGVERAFNHSDKTYRSILIELLD